MINCTKRWLVGLLAVSLLLPGCASDGATTSDTTVSSGSTDHTETVETADPSTVFGLPEKKEIGGELKVYNCFSDASSLFITTALTVESTTGDTIGDAIYKRNQIIEENYGVKLVEIPVKVNDQNTTLRNSIQAGDNSFDFAMVRNNTVSALAMEGMCTDLAELESLDLEKVWWDQRANEQMRMGEHLYYTYSDFATTHYDMVRCFFFNKSIASEYELPDLYSIVREGEWTLEKMQELGMQVSADNGDGVWNESDQYGFIGVPSTSLSAMLVGADAAYVTIEDGYPKIGFTTEHFVDAYNRILDCVFNDNFFYTGAKKNTVASELFVEGHSLFLLTTMSNTKTLRTMDTDFGILPLPKYDAAQENYWCNSPSPYAIMIPYNNPDPERTAFLIEALSYYSYLEVRPAYFDVMLHGRVSRDEQSSEMLDLIFSNLMYTVPLETSVDYSSKINKMMQENDRSITSYLTSVQGTVEKHLDAFIEKIKG